MRALIKRLITKTLLVDDGSGANEEGGLQQPPEDDHKGSPCSSLLGPMPLRCTRCLTRHQQSLQKGEHTETKYVGLLLQGHGSQGAEKPLISCM